MTTTTARRVILESPYAADTDEERDLNVAYARLCMRDCLLRGQYPFASHLLYTQPNVLDDRIPEERQLGIDAGLDWGAFADASVVYTDFGLTEGMKKGISSAAELARSVHYYYFFEDNCSKIIPLEYKYRMFRQLLRLEGDSPRKVGFCFGVDHTLEDGRRETIRYCPMEIPPELKGLLW